MVEVICAVVAALSAVACAIIGVRGEKNKKAEEKHTALRAEESLLSLRMMDAAVQLGVVSANALTHGHNNGNVEEARKAAQKARSEYQAFLQRTAAQEIGGK